MSAANLLLPTCKVEAAGEVCGREAVGFGSRCRLHEVLHSARYLDADQFASLPAELAALGPLSADERRERSIRTRLWDLEWKARDFHRARGEAATAGASTEQIAAAIAAGIERVSP